MRTARLWALRISLIPSGHPFLFVATAAQHGCFLRVFSAFCLFSVRRFVASNRFGIRRQTLWQASEGEGGGKKDGHVVGCSYLLVFPASRLHLHFPLMCRGDLWGAIWRLGAHKTDMQIDFFAWLFIYFWVALSFHELRCLLAPCRYNIGVSAFYCSVAADPALRSLFFLGEFVVDMVLAVAVKLYVEKGIFGRPAMSSRFGSMMK